MGAEQSSTEGPRSSDNASKKTDYYELLGVDRQASDDEIKKAYRKKALELHPDRNYGDAENATAKFAEVQVAYEMLSDAQERAWYDSHREAILRGDDPNDVETPAEYHNVRMTTADELYTLVGKFNSTVPFTDAPNGFFGILAETFDSLAQQEIAACEWDGQPIVEYPSFGKAKDDYDGGPRRFYSVWANFVTRKSFEWKDKWRLSDAPDRRIRRLMEKENKKFREDAIREFNDAVRSLVAFVRKRDPRYIPNMQSEAERQKILRDAAAAQAARSRAAHQEKMSEYVVPEWAQSRGDDNGLEGEFSESEEESEVEVFECVVCNKSFKTEKQYEAHEKSRKHLKAVQQLRRQMKKENAHLDLEEPSATAPPAIESEEEQEAADAAKGEDSAMHAAEVADHAETVSTNKTEPAEAPTNMSSGDESEDDDYAPIAAIVGRLASSKSNPLLEDDIDVLSSQADDVSLTNSAPAKKISMAKAKKAKKAAKQAALASSHKCAVCNETFESKTKLFAHLEKEGHAVFPGSSKPAGKPPKGKKKR